MQITITGRHVEIPDSVKKYAEEKISKLEKYSRRLIEAHIIIEKQKERFIAEVNVVGAYIKFVAKEESGDMHSSIDLVLDNAVRQLKKQRDKVKTHKFGGFFKKVFSSQVPAEEVKNVDNKKIQVSKYDAGKPKTVDEAIAELDVFKTSLMVFRNAETNDINVVQKKNDGNIVLIEPEQ